MKLPKVVIARRSQIIDLEYAAFHIDEGQTYLDDGTTVFHVYIEAGLGDGTFEKATREPSTIIVTHPDK